MPLCHLFPRKKGVREKKWERRRERGREREDERTGLYLPSE